VGASAIRLLSGSFLSAATGLVLGLASKTDSFIPAASLELGERWKIYWPEFESYLTQKGATVKFMVPFTAHELKLEPSLEAGTAQKGMEPGLRAVLGNHRIQVGTEVFVHLGGGYWIESSFRVSPIPWFSLVAGFQYGSGYSFRREIMGARLDGLHPSEGSPFIGASFQRTF
jgi:hypothetical protein